MDELHLRPQLSLFRETRREIKSQNRLRAYSPATARLPNCLYLGYRQLKEGLEVRLFFNWEDGKEFTATGGRFHGAYKGTTRVLNAHAALLRWIWADLHDDTEWPARLLRKTTPRNFLIPWPSKKGGGLCDMSKRASTLSHLELCLSGLKPLPELVLPHEEPDAFLQRLWMCDQIALNVFHSKIASRANYPYVQNHAHSNTQGDARRFSEQLDASQHCFPNLELEFKGL